MSLALLLLILMQQPAPVSTLESLSSQVEVGDGIRVIDANGAQSSGRFVGVTANSLQIAVNGVSREISGAAIRQVQLRRPDPKWNGTLIGGGIGALGALLITSGNNDAEQTFYERAVFVPLFTGIGLGGGALIDFAIKRYRTVFQASPLISKTRKGMTLQVRF